MIADTSEGGAIRVACNHCPALSAPVKTRSWRVARDAATGWTVGRGLSTSDACPRCAISPATRPLVECAHD
jgi:hypothetical protein